MRTRSTWPRCGATLLSSRAKNCWRSCLPKAEVNAVGDAPVILAANGGPPQALPPSADPIADWLDLMEVVEALCPEWPLPEPPQPRSEEHTSELQSLMRT